MSAAAPSATQGNNASANATGATRNNAAGKPAREASGATNGADLFSNLLSLLSATFEPPASVTPDTDLLGDADTAAGDAPADPNANPLAALLTWPGPGSTLAPTPPSGTLAAQAQGMAGAGTPPPPTTPPATDPALQGMTVLDIPAEPDAQTLAALGRGTSGEPGADATSALEPAAPTDPAQASAKTPPPALGQVPTTRSLQWRSAGAVAQHAVAAPSATVSAHQQHSATLSVEVGPSQTTASLTAMHSTVALHDRMGRASITEAPALAAEGAAAGPFALSAGGGAGTQTGSGASGGGGAQPGALTESGEAELSTDEAWSESAQEAALGGEADPEAELAGHWGTQNLRHASLRVGEGGEDAIDIQLSMSGQEVQVDFRTDSAEARASLAQNAGESLADLLQRSGIQLGGVSVGGGQGQASGGTGQRPADSAIRAARTSGAPGAADSATQAPVPPRPRADGSQPLDLFV